MTDTFDPDHLATLTSEKKDELRRWVPRYEHRAMTSGYDTLALLNELAAQAAELATLRARVEEAVGLIEELIEPDTGQPSGMDLGGHLLYANPVPKAERFLARLAASTPDTGSETT